MLSRRKLFPDAVCPRCNARVGLVARLTGWLTRTPTHQCRPSSPVEPSPPPPRQTRSSDALDGLRGVANHLSLSEERRRRLTRHMAIVTEYRDGRPVAQIARAYGVADATVSSLAQRFGEGRRRRVKQLFPDIAKAYADGLPLREIQARFEVDRKTVWSAVRKAGVPLRRPRQAVSS